MKLEITFNNTEIKQETDGLLMFGNNGKFYIKNMDGTYYENTVDKLFCIRCISDEDSKDFIPTLSRNQMS